MDKIKMFFANIIAKIKGLFKKDKSVYVTYTPPTAPFVVHPDGSRTMADGTVVPKPVAPEEKYLDFGPRAPGNEVDK